MNHRNVVRVASQEHNEVNEAWRNMDIAKENDSSDVLNQILGQLQKMGSSNDGVKYMVWKKGRDEHVDVYVRVSVVSVGDIDAVKQEFQCEFYMNLRWKECTLAGREIVEEEELDWDSVWDPGVYIIDAVNFDVYERYQKAQAPKNPGDWPEVVQYYHIKGTFKEVLEVNNFPFDYQDLALTLTSNWHADKLTLVKDDEKDDNIHTWNFYAKQEWDLQRHVITETLTLKPTEGSSGNSYPQYRIRMNVMRQYNFYIYNVSLIMCLITALTFTSFAVKTDAVGDRIQITLTLMLTSVAFKYYVQQFVPTVSYLTLLDKYVLACMVFQFFMAVYNAVSGMITNAKVLSYSEWSSFIAGLVIFVIMHIIFGLISWKKVKSAEQKITTDKMSYKSTNPGQIKAEDAKHCDLKKVSFL